METQGAGMAERRSLLFEGEVDAYGYDTDLCDVSPTIGGRNVIGEVEVIWPWRGSGAPKPEVEVLLGVEPIATGRLWTLHGFGGTEVTPAEPPEFTVGEFDLIARLRELDGRTVALLIRGPVSSPFGGTG